MSVVGLDFGNLSVLIGQAGRGGVDVILNDSSNRQTASYVSIQGKQRFLGDSGSAMVSNFSNCHQGNEYLRVNNVSSQLLARNLAYHFIMRNNSSMRKSI